VAQGRLTTKAGGVPTILGDPFMTVSSSWVRKHRLAQFAASGGVSLSLSGGGSTDLSTDTVLSTHGADELHVITLDAYAGQSVVSADLVNSATSPAGETWNLYTGEVTLVRADGSVVPIFVRQPGLTFTASSSGVTAASAFAETMPDPPVDQFQDVTYFLDDHLGTAQVQLGYGGWPVWQGQFTPFGSELNDGFTAMHYKFTGKERDAETGDSNGRNGLDDFGARYYASAIGTANIGRWMSPDPVIMSRERENPQSWNKYSYVFNNPLGRTDPTGEWPTPEHTREFTAVFGKNGYNLGDHAVAVMASASHLQDCWRCGGQSASAAPTHAMSNGFKALFSMDWAKRDAQTAYQNYVSSTVQEAAYAQAFYEEKGGKGYSDFALATFAQAAHAVQDNDSPEHTGFQPWFGSFDPGGPAHVLDEWLSSIRTDSQDAAARKQSEDDTRALWQTFQSDLNSARKSRHNRSYNQTVFELNSR